MKRNRSNRELLPFLYCTSVLPVFLFLTGLLVSCFDIQHYIVDVSFDEIDDPQLQQRLKQIPTSFNLSGEEVDQLIATGEALLQQSRDFQRFLDDMR